jgi:adenine-specific DNA glycosylase
MWQFTTVEADTDAAEPAMLGQRLGIPITDLRKIGQVRQALTHRRYVFDIFTAVAEGRGSPQAGPMRRWVKLPELDRYPLPRPHAKVAEMLSRLAFNGRQCPREL